MKRVLILMAVLTVIALAIPVMAMPTSLDPDHEYWPYQWFTGFDDYNTGALANPNTVNINNSPVTGFDSTGQKGWVSPKMTATATLGSTNASGNVFATPLALSGPNVYQPGPGGNSQLGYANSRDMRYLNNAGVSSHEGFVEYWMYDPRGTGTLVETDTRAWLASPAFNPASTLTSSSYTWGATLGDSRINGKTNWVFHHSGTFIDATGTGATTSGGAGAAGSLVFTRVAGEARVRSMGWHQIQLYWNYTASTARFEMYVDDMVTPCVVGDMNSGNSRWANMRGGVASLYIGNTQGVTTKAGLIDEVSFYTRDLGGYDPDVPTPEPSGLMALGAGVIGLLGIIRRRK